MSLYADYLREVFKKEVIELDSFLAVYSIENDIFYLEDIYIRPEYRDQGIVKKMMENIVQIAKDNNCTRMLGSIATNSTYKNENMSKFLKYGFSIHSTGNNIIYLMKDI